MKRKNKKKPSLFLRISAPLLIGLVIIILVITTQVTTSSREAFINTYAARDAQILNQIETELGRFNSDLQSLIAMLGDSWAFQRYLHDSSEMSSSVKFLLYQSISNDIKSSTVSENFNDITVVVVGINGNTFVSSNDVLNIPVHQLLSCDAAQQATADPYRINYTLQNEGFTDYTAGSSTMVAAKALLDTDGKVYSIVFVLIPQEKMCSYYLFDISESESIEIVDQNGIIYSSPDESRIGNNIEPELLNIAAMLCSDNKDYSTIDIDGVEYAVVATRVLDGNFYMIHSMGLSQLIAKQFNLTPIVGSSVMVITPIIVVMYLIIYITLRPLRRMASQMVSVTTGDFSQKAEVSGSSETCEIAESYNYMLDGLNKYVGDLMNAQNERRAAEIHALQMQINPHFICNTFSAVKWMVWRNEKESAISMIDAIISLLERMMTFDDEFITVDTEISMLNSYTDIYHFRYGEGIRVEIFCGEDDKSFLIPKLTLQPFLENAFFHAFPGRDTGLIEIFIQRRGNYLICEIRDDGVGMDIPSIQPDIESRAAALDTHRHLSGIGIENVDERLKLLFNDSCGVTLSSKKGEGTLVTITVPLIEKTS